MTNFDKSKNLSVEGGFGEYWVIFSDDNGRKVVARFKHGSAKASANHFVKFLVKNFTVEEYFEARRNKLAPEQILEQKGYIGYNLAKGLKQMGYEPTAEGKAQWHADRMAQYETEAKAKQVV